MKAERRALWSAVAGLVAGGGTALVAGWQASLLVGFDVAALCFVLLLWIDIRGLDHGGTQAMIRADDASAGLIGSVVVVACVAGLAAEILGLVHAEQLHGTARAGLIVLALLAVVSGLVTVHSVYTLHYARLYFDDDRHGIDFNGDEPPDFSDFAYFAFTVGMTYQVSDTSLSDRRIRRAVTRHALVSFLFGTVIIGTTINVMAGLVGR